MKHLTKKPGPQAWRQLCKLQLNDRYRWGLKINTHVDNTFEAVSHKFGRRSDKLTAPNMRQPKEEVSQTTMRVSYKPPTLLDKPNFRSRHPGKDTLFDVTAMLKVKLNSANLMTGYESNRQLWDGTTWRTEKNQHTDQVRTSYRNEFNKLKPFHLNKVRDTTGRLRKLHNVFDLADNPTSHPM